MKKLAIGWLLALAVLHFSRDWFAMNHLYAEAKWFLMPWGMSGYVLPATFVFIKKPEALLAGNVLPTVYELWFTYRFIFYEHPSGGAWWMIEPIFVSLIFVVPAVGVLLVQVLSSGVSKPSD